MRADGTRSGRSRLLILCTAVALAGCSGGNNMQAAWKLSEKDLPGIQPHVRFVDSTGRPVEPEELAHFDGTVSWTIEDEDRVPSAALARAQAGMQAGSSNDLERAMKRFREAHRLAPRWAQPVYQGAWTALLLGDAALAETLYA